MIVRPLLDYNDPEINARQNISPNASCDVDGEYADIRNLMHLARKQEARIADLEAQLAEVAKERDEALEELGKVIMACPVGQRSMPISRTVASMRSGRKGLLARIAELEAALAPFAKVADVYDKHPAESFRRNHTDDTPIHAWVPAYCGRVVITVGDARRAAKVLTRDT